jgi:uncharacterized paraquat-inducible protein A
MSVERRDDGPEAVRIEQRIRRTERVATGTLACPACDAPVAPAGRMSPAESVACPYCGHGGAVRDFLSLAAPSRPARVAVRVVRR